MEKSTSVLFPFLCDDCGWSYETSDKLQQHIQQEHMVEYSCSQPVDSDNGDLTFTGEHQRLRLHIKRNFVTTINRSTEINPGLSSGTEVQEHRDRAVCKKCNISFISKLLFERHLKGHVHERELAVKVRRIQIPDDVLRDVSNSFVNQASEDEAPKAEFGQDVAAVVNVQSADSSALNVGKCSSFSAPPVSSSLAILDKQSGSTIQTSSSMESMETPMSSELLSRSLLDELSGYMKDVTESILTSPQKGMDSNFDQMTVVDPPSKSVPLPVEGINNLVAMQTSDGFQPSPTRDYSQPPAFPRVCSSPTESKERISPPKAFTIPRSAGLHNPPNPRLSAILQLPNMHNRPSPPPLSSIAHTQTGSSFLTSTTGSSSHFGSSVLTASTSYYGNTVHSTNSPATNTSNSFGIRCSSGSQLNANNFSSTSSSVPRNSPLTNSHAGSAPLNVVSMHTIPSRPGSNQGLTTVAPSQTDTRLAMILSGGQTSTQSGQSLQVSSTSALTGSDRCQSVKVISQGQPSQAMQRTSSASSSPGTRRTPPSLNTSASGRQNLQSAVPVSAANPLALLNQMNISVSRGPTTSVETNVSIQERPASVIVLENPLENTIPSIHSVVSLHPGYKHESWGNIVVPASEAGAQHIHQNPSSHCQCLTCRDIRGGDLLRKSQQVENGRCEYKCPKCRRLFTQKTSFIRHCKTFRHAFICDMCHCGFLTEAPYETHKSLHLMKGLLHSTPPRAPPSAPNRPQVPGSRPVVNQQMTSLEQQRQQQVIGLNHSLVLLQQQRKQGMQPRRNQNVQGAQSMHSAPKPSAEDADDDVVVLEPAPGSAMASTRKPQYKRTVERSMTGPATANSAKLQQNRSLAPNVLLGNRTALVPPRAGGILQQQQQQPQKSTTTMQPLATATISTPPQISRILNNSELTLTPINRPQNPTPPTSAADLVLRTNPNMQLTDNGPQKPVQINVSSSVVGLAQPITATPRKHLLPNILAKRLQPTNTSSSSSPPGNALVGGQMKSGGATFAVPQSQPCNVYRVVPSASARSGLKPMEAPSGNYQMNSINRPNVSSATPLWHHPVNASRAQLGPSPMAGRQASQMGGRGPSGNMNLRPQSLPSSHQSHGPNRYPSALGQPQGNSPVRYAGPVRLPPPPSYSQSTSMVSPAPYSQNRQQQGPPTLHPMQNVSGMPAPGQAKERMVKCKICGGIFPTVSALQNHFEQTHANAIHQQQALGMQRAPNLEPRPGNLLFQQLQRLHHPQQPNLQQPQHPCLQQVQQANQLQPGQQTHQRQQIQLSQQHQTLASYSCGRCQKIFQSLLQFKSHETLCREKIPCMKCNEMVFKNELLSHYSKMHHNGNPPFGLEYESPTDGTQSNRISPNNPIFALPSQAAMTIGPGYQPNQLHPENSSLVNVESSQITTEPCLTGTIPSQQEFARDGLQNITAESTLAIAGFSLNEASDSLVNQMSIASEHLLPPPPLVKLSIAGSNGNCIREAIQEQGMRIPIASADSSVPSDTRYFTNEEIAPDDMQYPIIQSVQSLSEISEQIPLDLQHETAYEKPLTPVVALVDELVNAVEEECNKDSLLDEASGLFVKVNQELPVCESEDGSNSIDALSPSARPSEASVNRDFCENDEEPFSAVTDSGSNDFIEENSEGPAEQADDSAWLHEPLSEDSCDKPPTLCQKIVPEPIGAILRVVPMETLSKSGELEHPIVEPRVVAVSDFESSGNVSENDMVSKDISSRGVRNMDDSEMDEGVEDTRKFEVKRDKDDSMSAIALYESVEHVESAEDSISKPVVEEKDKHEKDMDVDSKSECGNEKANDSDTDTVALEDDGETSEPATAEGKPATCPICDLEFDSRKALVEHSRIHLSATAHRCTFCDGTFSTNKLLRSHIRTHMRSCREPPRNCGRKRRRLDDLVPSGAPENMAIALFDYDKVAENTEILRRLGIYGFIRFSDMKDFFCGKRKKPREPPLINLPDDDDEN